MQIITIAGNIGKDAETRTTQGGDKITSWSVAVSTKTGQNEVTTWWDCALFGKRGEALAQYLTKGNKVTVSGRFSTREHEGKTYLKIDVAEVALQGGKPSERSDDTRHRNDDRGYQAPPARQAYDDLESEIPF